MAPHLFPIDIDEVWARPVDDELGGTALQLLSPEDRLLHFSIHRSRSALRLRLVCDITELLGRASGTLDWDYILQRAVDGYARTPLYNRLLLAHELLGTPLVPDVLSHLKIGPIKRRVLAQLWGPR